MTCDPSEPTPLPMLTDWGWDDKWAALLATSGAQPEAQVGRIAGKFSGLYPVTGDWVTVQPGPAPSAPVSIGSVLPRRASMSRGRAGEGDVEQVLASNMDVVWIVHGLDTPPNPRRIERYLTAAWESGAVPEIVLTKADLTPDVADARATVEAVAIGVTIHVVSLEQTESIEQLRAHLRLGRTIALLGPSGAGKSSLINALANASLSATAEVRTTDKKGRHTTTRRELFPVPGGALLMDTPGLREFRVWAVDEGLVGTFPEIDALAASCRFRDCQHDTEPGCAVIAATPNGGVDADRLASYRKLKAEGDYLDRKSDPLAQAAAVAKHKTAMKTMKYHQKFRRSGD